MHRKTEQVASVRSVLYAAVLKYGAFMFAHLSVHRPLLKDEDVGREESAIGQWTEYGGWVNAEMLCAATGWSVRAWRTEAYSTYCGTY